MAPRSFKHVQFLLPRPRPCQEDRHSMCRSSCQNSLDSLCVRQNPCNNPQIKFLQNNSSFLFLRRPEIKLSPRHSITNPGLNLVNHPVHCWKAATRHPLPLIAGRKMRRRIYWRERECTRSPDKTIFFYWPKLKSTVNKSLTIGLINNQASNTCHKTLTDVLIGSWYKKVIEYLLWCILINVDEMRWRFA